MLDNNGIWLDNGKLFDVEGDTGWEFGFGVGVNRQGSVVVGSPA
jgi:hypothetical protein